MATDSKFIRALVAFPFLVLAAVCFYSVDLERVASVTGPVAQKGILEWDFEGHSGSLPLISKFYNWEFLDDLWAGTIVAFAPSAIGYDQLSAWQTFSFLSDAGPLFAIVFLESSRPVNRWTLSYFPAVVLLGAQVLTFGVAGQIYFLFYIVFNSAAVISSPSQRNISTTAYALLPAMLVFHTFLLYLAYIPGSLERRLWGTWAWQMVPVWAGFANSTISVLLGIFSSGKPTASYGRDHSRAVLLVLSSISAGVWLYTLLKSPYSLSEMFLPLFTSQERWVLHMRELFQVDEVFSFGGSFLWLWYLFTDLKRAGILKTSRLLIFGVTAHVTLVAGPGAGLSVAWLWREEVLYKDAATKEKATS